MLRKKKLEQSAPIIKISPPETNKNCIPCNEGLTPEVISKHWHKIRLCDPNEIITKKKSKPNKFNDPNFKCYYLNLDFYLKKDLWAATPSFSAGCLIFNYFL